MKKGDLEVTLASALLSARKVMVAAADQKSDKNTRFVRTMKKPQQSLKLYKKQTEPECFNCSFYKTFAFGLLSFQFV